MQRQLADHRAHDAQLVRDLRHIGKQIANPQAALPALPKSPRTAEPDTVRGGLGTLGDSPLADLLPLALLEHGLWIEGVHVAGSAVHEAKDDALRAGRKMRCFRPLPGSSKEALQGQPAESRGRRPKNLATGQVSSNSAVTTTARTRVIRHEHFPINLSVCKLCRLPRQRSTLVY